MTLTATGLPPKMGGHAAHGTVGVVGFLLEYKHGIPEIIQPFIGSTSFIESIEIPFLMKDQAFMVWIIWILILAGSTYSLVIAIYGYMQRIIYFFKNKDKNLPSL